VRRDDSKMLSGLPEITRGLKTLAKEPNGWAEINKFRCNHSRDTTAPISFNFFCAISASLLGHAALTVAEHDARRYLVDDWSLPCCVAWLPPLAISHRRAMRLPERPGRVPGWGRLHSLTETATQHRAHRKQQDVQWPTWHSLHNG
jgi:hypothetical protein